MSVLARIHAVVEHCRDDERGASLVEYALLVALIAIVCIAAVTALGEATSEVFSDITSQLD